MELLEISADLLQISTNQVDEVLGEFRCDLLFGAVDQMETDMGFENLSHEAVDASADGCQQHELVAAILVPTEGSFDGIELAAKFAHPLQEFDGFTFKVGHGWTPLDNTYPGYGINAMGVSLFHPILPPPVHAHPPGKAS
jgi:hypothetical protein